MAMRVIMPAERLPMRVEAEPSRSTAWSKAERRLW